MKKKTILLLYITHTSFILSVITPPTPKVLPPTAKTPAAPKTTTTPTPPTNGISIPLAYDVRIMNTSTTPATLTSVTIAYGLDGKTYSIKKNIPTGKNTIPANYPETLLTHQNMLSFGASIIIPTEQSTAAATFQGITSIEVDGQTLNLSSALAQEFGSSTIYITNTTRPGQPPLWKLTTEPKQAPAPKTTQPPVISSKTKTHTVGTNIALQSAAAPLMNLPITHPYQPAVPHPKTPATSKATGSATMLLNPSQQPMPS